MNGMTLCFRVVIAAGLLLAFSRTSVARPLHGSVKHRPAVVAKLFTPHGRPVATHHDRYRYVVPSSPRHGAFYTYENTYYYSPVASHGDAHSHQPVPVTFGGSKHLEELSERIEFLANELCLDLHHNYRHNPGFKEAYRTAYEFLTAAKFIHNREHQGDRAAVRVTVTRIDELFHHIESDFGELQRRENRPIGDLSFNAKIEELQALVHHLLYDQGVKPSHPVAENNAAGAPLREEAPPAE